MAYSYAITFEQPVQCIENACALISGTLSSYSMDRILYVHNLTMAAY